jgi:two-component system, cell cycle sensor histidine kinase and response regulator CckA
VEENAGQMRGHVLLVDDEKAVLDVTRMILEHFGFTVVAAKGGLEAIERFAEQAGDIHVVILDLTMPDVSGAEVFSRMRERRPDVPILLSSGYTASSVPAELAGQPRTGFLQKPYQASALIGKVQELIAPPK